MNKNFPSAITKEEIKANLQMVKMRIQLTCEKVKRDASEVRLLPVSKTISNERILFAYEAGERLLGENKVQEAQRKSEDFKEYKDMKWAVIGHLQSNKIKHMAKFAAEFHALDSLKVARILDRELESLNRVMDVLIQVNTSGEESKYGLHPNDVINFAKEMKNYPRLKIKGLMTLALNSSDLEKVRPCFVLLRNLRDEIQSKNIFDESFKELSMGMSGDFEVAIEEGATIIRVGQMIFGKRETPDSFYWPSGKDV